MLGVVNMPEVDMKTLILERADFSVVLGRGRIVINNSGALLAEAGR